MTLLLTSAGMQVKDEILKIIPKPADQIKLAHIITASKVENDTSYVLKDKEAMIKIGFQVEDVDIEGKTEDQLRDLLKDKDMIVVQGGNTFYLLKAVRESGFDRVLKELIDQGKIYIGISAGSIIVGPSIEVTSFGDKNLYGVKDFTGLNLIDFAITPHAQKKELSIYRELQEKVDYKIRAITDDQAFLVKDGEVSLVGKGKEMIV